jgi:hypothetical protein
LLYFVTVMKVVGVFCAFFRAASAKGLLEPSGATYHVKIV